MSQKKIRVAFMVAAAAAIAWIPLVAENPDHREALEKSPTHSCVKCDLADASLWGVNATGDLSGTSFAGAKLYKANFQGANLKGATFAGADLKGANFKDAIDADLSGALTDATTTCPDGSAGPCQ